MRTTLYYEQPFYSLCEARDLVEFYIIDVQYEQTKQGKFLMATCEVALSKDLSKATAVSSVLGFTVASLTSPKDLKDNLFIQGIEVIIPTINAFSLPSHGLHPPHFNWDHYPMTKSYDHSRFSS